MKPSLALASLLAALAGAVPSVSAGPDDRAVSVTVGYAGLSMGGDVVHGGGLGVDHWRGITDSLSIRGAVAAALAGGTGTSYLVDGAIGLGYALDVLRYVPYLDAGAAVLLVGGALPTEVIPAVSVGAGLDVLRGRGSAWGPYLRATFAVDGTEAALVTAGVRLSHRWGYF